jgi:hypothetical protein
MKYDGEGVMGNREVPRREILRLRGDLHGARTEACSEEEGGPRGKHGSPRATEPEAEEVA